jgi:progressive ankylosis protein
MTQDRSARAVLVFWIPLALQWVMMALEGPFLAAVIARLPDPAFNLAAYGVAFAFAILVESPVIMLMSASTALVEDGDSYRKLRRFAGGLNLLSTGLLLLVLLPPVYDLVMRSGLGLPEPVADLAYGALWLLLPWPAAIGYRRFLHGLLIRSGRTRRVAYGTGIRLAAMAGTALLLARTGVPGVWVGASALSAGVMVEALVARFMARQVVRELVEAGGVPPSPVAPPEPEAEGEPVAGSGGAGAASRAAAPESHAPGSHLTFGTIARFYYPLALTSLIGLTTQPILTFFMGRSPSPVESLALFPWSWGWPSSSTRWGSPSRRRPSPWWGAGGNMPGSWPASPWGWRWRGSWRASGPWPSPPGGRLVQGGGGASARAGGAGHHPRARVAVILPFLAVVLAFQRALLVQARDTRPITLATALEVAGIALLFPVLGWGLGWMGVTAAFGALLGGRVLGVGFLLLRMGRVRLSAP